MSEGSDHPLKLMRPHGRLKESALISHVPSLYNETQLSEYFVRIGQKHAVIGFSPTLENLEKLVQLHFQAFPFENTDMHYTAKHQADVTPYGAFKRMVQDKRGSYCFGHGAVVLEVLRGLNYRVYSGCAKVNRSYDFYGPPIVGRLNHVILFVQPFPLDSNRNKETYIVDIWFGSQTFPHPFLLSDGEDNIIDGASPYERYRLIRRLHSVSSFDKSCATSERDDVLWCVEYQRDSKEIPHDADTPNRWRVLYAFTEDEFHMGDIHSGSPVISNGPRNMFTDNVIVVRHFPFDHLDESGLADALEEFAEHPEEKQRTFFWKYIMYGNVINRIVGRKSVLVMTLENEESRIRALKNLFLIDIPEDSRHHIRETPAYLDKEGKDFGEIFPNFT